MNEIFVYLALAALLVYALIVGSWLLTGVGWLIILLYMRDERKRFTEQSLDSD